MAVGTPRGPKHVVHERARQKRLERGPLDAGEARIEQLFISNSIDPSDVADFLAAVKVVSKVRMRTLGER
jgi:hypothetical protein